MMAAPSRSERQQMRTWFVTGSSRGLGRDIVVAALEAGDQIVATARDPADLADLAEHHPDRLLPLALDVTNAAMVDRAMAEALARFGRIDIGVNNAGYANTASLEDMRIDDFERQVETNFFGTVRVTKALLPIMREQGGGHIFQIASVGARIATVGLSAYQSAKFAVRGFSLVVAQEVAPLGIRMTVVQPGGMRTDWAGSSMHVPEPSPPYRDTVGTFAAMLRSHSGHEASDPAKVAKVIVDLAGREDAPVDLLIGTDAFEYAGQAARRVLEADEAWRAVTVSVSA